MIDRFRFQKKATVLWLLAPLLSFSQLEIPEGYTLVTESPSNGKQMSQKFFDFDADGEEDTALVVEDAVQFSAYKFIMYLSSQNKTYEVDLINLQEMSVYPVQIKTRKNVVEFGYYEEGSGAFGRFIKLRYQPKTNQVQVIGYDVIYRALPTEHIAKSYNLVTGKYIVKKTIYDENSKDSFKQFSGKSDAFKNNVFIENLDVDMLVSLDAVGSDFEKLEKKALIDKYNLGEDIAEINCYVKNISRVGNVTCIDIEIIQVNYTEEGERIIRNENPKIRTYIVDDTTIIYGHDCQSITPEKLTEIEKLVLDDKSIIVIGSSKDGVLESINFGCYG